MIASPSSRGTPAPGWPTTRISASKGRCGCRPSPRTGLPASWRPRPRRPGRCPRPSAPAVARDRRVSNRVLIAGATEFILSPLSQPLALSLSFFPIPLPKPYPPPLLSLSPYISSIYTLSILSSLYLSSLPSLLFYFSYYLIHSILLFSTSYFHSSILYYLSHLSPISPLSISYNFSSISSTFFIYPLSLHLLSLHYTSSTSPSPSFLLLPTSSLLSSSFPHS